MKIYELLTIPQLTGMQVIAGDSGTEREVESVNMMDAPDIIQFLKRMNFWLQPRTTLKIIHIC